MLQKLKRLFWVRYFGSFRYESQDKPGGWGNFVYQLPRTIGIDTIAKLEQEILAGEAMQKLGATHIAILTLGRV